ncbi:MAG: IgGFc-binding protein [Tannerella sp.]|jgi:hypothetical protein|nr:IgGFc-binding protein [Tannerella sp.]
MKTNKLLFVLCMCLLGLTATAQNKEFWFVAPCPSPDWHVPVFFMITNLADEPVAVEMTFYNGGSLETYMQTIAVGGYWKYDLPDAANAAKVENPYSQAGNVTEYGVHITSSQPVSAYYMIASNDSRDFFTLKGEPALGREFYVPMQSDNAAQTQGYTNACDQIDIVATEDGTTVTVNPKGKIKVNNVDQAAGISLTKTLNRGQTLKIMESDKNQIPTLSGTHITADKDIAVTVTEDLVGAADTSGDQLIPVKNIGKTYVVPKGFKSDSPSPPNTHNRVYIVATRPGTDVNVITSFGSTQVATNMNAGDTYRYTFPANASVATIRATQPVYVYHRTGFNEEGAAIVPSIYTLSRKTVSFYATSAERHKVFIVYRPGTESSFTIKYGSSMPTALSVGMPTPVPDFTGLWSFAEFDLTASDVNGKVVTIANPNSIFSLGYIAANIGPGTMTCYGYMSGFDSFKFPLDTLWNCVGSQTCISDCADAHPVFSTGLTNAEFWTWIRNDTDTLGRADHDTTVIATVGGKYKVIIEQDGYNITDSCYVLDMVYDANMHRRLPAKPAKVTVPQIFNVEYGPGKSLPSGIAANKGDSGVWCEWKFTGGGEEVISSDMNHAEVIWNTTGRKEVELHLYATGVGCMINGVIYNKTCDTTLHYCVEVHPKNIGFFVDWQVDSKVKNSLHDGTSWENAFPTIQQALALASQGDWVWVAEGAYSPRDGFPDNTDYAMVSTAGYLCDYDSLTVYTPSYVMDWDSVQVFGGFAGTEHNLSERDIVEHLTVLRGGDRSVIVMDGSTAYTSGLWGLTRGACWDGFTIRDGAATQGGGVWFRNGASGIFANDVIKRNTATGAGGGVCIDGPYTGPVPGDGPAFCQVEISGNMAEDGAGIYNAGSSVLLLNVTVGGNLAASRGGGLYTAGGSPVIRNTIIHGNRADVADDDMTVSGGVPYVAKSDIGRSMPGKTWDTAFGTDGGGNTDMNPGYLIPGFNTDGHMQEGYYRLCCMDFKTVEGGYNNYLWMPFPVSVVLSAPTPRNTVYGDYMDRDLAGDARIINENVDMGAYERQDRNSLPLLIYGVEVPAVEGAEGMPPPGVYYVKANSNFTFRLTPDEGRSLEHTELTTGSVRQDERGYMEVTENANGARTYIFHDITEPLKIRVTGVTNATPQGTDETGDGLSIWSAAGHVYVEAPSETVLRVYTLAGSLQIHRRVSGRTALPLPSGLYIVVTEDGRRQRVIVL